MITKFGHIQFNSRPESQDFYVRLFSTLGWKTIYQDDNMLGVGEEDGGSLWFSSPQKNLISDYDGIGVNHVGIHTTKQVDVDEVVRFLRENNIDTLFGTPRHRPEFSSREDSTYYQVMFESPDKLLFEVVYIGKKD